MNLKENFTGNWSICEPFTSLFSPTKQIPIETDTLANKKKRFTADSAGNWQAIVPLPTRPAGMCQGNFTLIASPLERSGGAAPLHKSNPTWLVPLCGSNILTRH
jgi:hypothetical protein